MNTPKQHVCRPGALALAVLLFGANASSIAQTVTAAPAGKDELRYVVIVSRHGVRSPTGKTGQLNAYSTQPWPAWTVPPGNLTAHGAKLMTLFGSYDRQLLASEGLFSADGCNGAERVLIDADSDQRTRETANAMSSGMFPGCAVRIHALAEGTPDPLFHVQDQASQAAKALAVAAISGRIGANPAGLVEAYRPQLQIMEDVLTGGRQPSAASSLFDIPASLQPGKGDHLAELRGPLGTSATMAENILLEYTEGMPMDQVGWGRVDENKLRALVQLHTASSDIAQRTHAIAVAQSSSMLSHILGSMQQAVAVAPAAGAVAPAAGALGSPSDRLLLLVGHDTNIASIAGALQLSWLIDGRRDDTPPGGALVFELWKKSGQPDYSVRTYYMAQTLDQMRNSNPLTMEQPPQRVALFLPGCSDADSACDWQAFQKTVRSNIDSGFAK